MRIPVLLFGKFSSLIITSVLILIIYTNAGRSGTKESIQDRNGALFFVSLNLGFGGFANIGTAFPSERPVFLREV
jgi:ABC-type multidrug transport system permease subunit